MSTRVLLWRGPEGADIPVGFDDDLIGLEAMEAEIAVMGEAHPNLPDEVPKGSSFTFAKDGTGHLFVRFRVGDSVYQKSDRGGLHELWEGVHYIARLLRPRHEEKAAS
jgi:hypothetical protein